LAPKWLIFFAWTFVIGTIASGVAEYTYFGSAEAGILGKLLTGWQGITFSNPLVAIGSIAIFLWDFIQTIFNMLLWNYGCFTGTWAIIRILGLCISMGFIVSFVFAIRGTPSSS